MFRAQRAGLAIDNLAAAAADRRGAHAGMLRLPARLELRGGLLCRTAACGALVAM
jgi:hypothetical protein